MRKGKDKNGSVDEPGTEDIFSKVMGKDKDGRARMYGLGVRASDVWGIVPSRPACYRETMQWKAAYEGISSELAEVKAMVLEMRGSNQNASCASSVPVTSTHRPKVATKHPTLQVCVYFNLVYFLLWLLMISLCTYIVLACC